MAMARWNSKSRGFGRPSSFSQHEQHRRCPGSRAPGWLVGRVTYHNPDNGYCVLRVKVRGHRDLVTVLGHVASISDSMSAELYPTYDTEGRDSEIRVVIDAGSFIELLDLSDLLEEGGGTGAT
jgi:hypothetical protein